MKNVLELIGKFSKVAECKINMQKYIAHLYINSELSKREIKEATPFTITSKIIKKKKNLLKEVKDMYSEDYKTLMNKIEGDTNGGI